MLDAPDLHDEFLSRLRTRHQHQSRLYYWRSKIQETVAALPTATDKRLFLGQLDREFCRRNFYYFLTNHWRTFYPDGKDKFGSVAVLFPRSRMAWMLAYTLNRYNSHVVDIVKSRQAPMASHFCCAYFCWKAMTQPGRMILFHSKDLHRAGFGGRKGNPECLLGRVKWGYQRLPKHIQAMVVKVEWDPNPNRPQIILWHNTGDGGLTPSIIMAVPDQTNSDVINTFSPSDIFDDEIGHQKNPEAFWNAAIPAMGGRQFLRVGTPDSRGHPEAHAHLIREILQGDGEEPPFCEMMPYSDSYFGGFLQRIYDDETDMELGHRFLLRVRNNGVVTIRLHSRARAGSVP